MAQPLQSKPAPPEPALDQFPPAESPDGVDLTLIRWTLSLTPLERIELLQDWVDGLTELRHEGGGGRLVDETKENLMEATPEFGMKLELVPVPVADIDRAKAFYVEKLGFKADHDVRPNDTVRILQLTPPGSACSILLAAGLPNLEMPPGSLRGLHLVVADIGKVREALAGRDVAVSGITDMGGIKFVSFSDPDGNTWILQEIPGRS
jgi:catechol 2,3-dioxygenase-like lactoylglutathione lyase family enzyme